MSSRNLDPDHVESATDAASVRLTSAGVAVTVDVSHGPRITSLVDPNGHELLVALDPPVTVGPDGGVQTQLRGGHRLWPAPEVPEVTYAGDDGPGRLERADELAVARDDGSPIARRVEVTLRDGVVHVHHVVTNTGGRVMEVAPWALTQVPPGGTVCLPVGRTATDPHGLQASGAIVTWPYTHLGDQRIRFHDDMVTVDTAGMADPDEAVKLGVDGFDPWVAYVRDDVVLVVRTDPRAPEGEVVDLGAMLQSYACDRFVELEVVGHLSLLEPGADRTLDETWTVHPRPPGDDRSAATTVRDLANGW